MNPQVSVFISIHWAERSKRNRKGREEGIFKGSSKTSVIV
jgi:hypothetical protein